MATTLNKQFKNICVHFGFHYGKYKEFVHAAIDLDRVAASGEQNTPDIWRR